MSGGGGNGGGGLFSDPLELALVAGTAIAAPYAAPALFEGGALLGSTALGAGVTGLGIGALGGAALGYNPVQTGLMGGLGGAAAGAMGVGAAAAPTVGTTAGAAGTTAASTAPVLAGTGAAAPTVSGAAAYDAGLAANTAIPGAAASTGAGIGGASTSLIPGISNTALGVGAGGLGLMALMKNEQAKYGTPPNSQVNWNGGSLANFKYDPQHYSPDVVMPPNPPYQPVYTNYQAAQGGMVPGYAGGGLMDPNSEPVDFMGGGMYPQSQQQRSYYATPTQMPTSAQATASLYEPKTNPLTGDEMANMATGGVVAFDNGGMAYDPNAEIQQQAMLARLSGLPQLIPTASAAGGKIKSLGAYSDGGQMLKGPGDGMSDSIPATIQGKQPARLADNEFVVPADVVSHIGNGSSDAGAKRLYAMMDKVRKARTGKAKQAPKINADKYMPA